LTRAHDRDPVAGAPHSLRVEASANIFDENFEHSPIVWVGLQKKVEQPAERVQQWARWTGDHNLFPKAGLFIQNGNGKDTKRLVLSTGLADWKQFWGDRETDAVEGGRPRYTGGDVLDKAFKTPEQVTPEDFRLHPQSAGHGAGPDGKDLGADVDLLGPGPAYEHWKKTPEYQQWLKETGQVTK
jgi:hypothetical protein